MLVTRPPAELVALLRRDAGPILRELPALAGLAEGVAGSRSSALADPERRQPRALEALLRWLGRLSAERPVVLALEDLHVADAATRAFATFVARIAREERIALVLSYQPDRLTREHPLRENLAVIGAGLRPPVRVDLGPFARREIAGLIEGIEGERPSASIVVLVAERSGGSPLVVEELVAARRELRNATLTGTLADLVAARLARRSPECRRLLRLLAPAERPMTTAELAVAAAAVRGRAPPRGLPPRSTSLPRRGTDLLDGGPRPPAWTEALEHGFVRRDADDRLVDPPRAGGARRGRRTCCPRSARATGRPSPTRSPDTPTIAAAFWRGAHRLDEAREAAIEAGRLAMRLEAPEDALAVLELGLDLPARAPAAGAPAPETLARDTDVELAQLAAEAAYAAMRPTRAVAYAESALAALGERRDRLAARRPGGASRPVPAWPRATPPAPRRPSGGPRTWRRRRRPWSAPGSWRCWPRSG